MWPPRPHSPFAHFSPARSRRAGSAVAGARGVTGLTPPAKALAVAAAAHTRLRGGRAVRRAGRSRSRDRRPATCASFSARSKALPDAVAERAVLPFPSHQVDPYRGLAPHFRVASARARALHAAALGSARVIVASAQALLPRLPAPESVLATSFDLRPGVEIDPHALAEILVEGGYERQDPVDEHGEFSLRGGILDVYPAGEDVADSHRVHRRLGRVDSPLRSRARSDRSRRSISFRSCPVREAGRSGTAAGTRRHPRPSSTICARRDRCASSSPSREDVRAQSREVGRAGRRRRIEERDATTRRRRANVARRTSCCCRWRATSRRSSRRAAMTLEELAIGDGSRRATAPAPRVHVPSQPAQEFRGRIPDWIAERQAGARSRRHHALRRQHARPRRAHRRAAARLRDPRAARRPRPTSASKAPCSSPKACCRAASGCPTPALQIYAETDVFEEERRRTTTQPQAIAGGDVPLGPARSQGRRSTSSTSTTASASSSA